MTIAVESVTSETEALQSAVQELKRADHSIAVSLKYTRTVDVIKSIVDRLINTINFCFDAALIHAISQKKISEIPTVHRLKAEKVKELYGENQLVADFCDFYFLLRKISKAKFERRQEYRRHVTMTAHLDTGESVEVTIDIITDYFDRTKEFLTTVSTIIGEK